MCRDGTIVQLLFTGSQGDAFEDGVRGKRQVAEKWPPTAKPCRHSIRLKAVGGKDRVEAAVVAPRIFSSVHPPAQMPKGHPWPPSPPSPTLYSYSTNIPFITLPFSLCCLTHSHALTPLRLSTPHTGSDYSEGAAADAVPAETDLKLLPDTPTRRCCSPNSTQVKLPFKPLPQIRRHSESADPSNPTEVKLPPQDPTPNLKNRCWRVVATQSIVSTVADVTGEVSLCSQLCRRSAILPSTWQRRAVLLPSDTGEVLILNFATSAPDLYPSLP